MMDKETTKQQIDELKTLLSGIQTTLQTAKELVLQENPDHEELFRMWQEQNLAR